MDHILEIKGLCKYFGSTIANKNIDFCLQRGEIRGLAGENGSGKSTLLQQIAGIYLKDEGTMLLNGKEYNPHNPIDAKKNKIPPYLCEDVIRVMDEDATRGSALSRALYAYLLNFMDLKKAAQQLGIHRNTLEYQVRKMNAVIGEPPDGSKRFRMMCTYKMLALPDTGVHDV